MTSQFCLFTYSVAKGFFFCRISHQFNFHVFASMNMYTNLRGWMYLCCTHTHTHTVDGSIAIWILPIKSIDLADLANSINSKMRDFSLTHLAGMLLFAKLYTSINQYFENFVFFFVSSVNINRLISNIIDGALGISVIIRHDLSLIRSNGKQAKPAPSLVKKKSLIAWTPMLHCWINCCKTVWFWLISPHPIVLLSFIPAFKFPNNRLLIGWSSSICSSCHFSRTRDAS